MSVLVVVVVVVVVFAIAGVAGVVGAAALVAVVIYIAVVGGECASVVDFAVSFARTRIKKDRNDCHWCICY